MALQSRVAQSQRPRRLDAARTREEVRAVLLDDLVAGEAVWLDAAGLSIIDSRNHSSLLKRAALFREKRGATHALSRGAVDHGTHTDQSTPLLSLLSARAPHTVVIDWSTETRAGADALTLFPVFVGRVLDAGSGVVCCEPESSEIGSSLEDGHLLEGGGVQWVSSGLQGVSTQALGISLSNLRSARGRRPLSRGRPTRRRARTVIPVLVWNTREHSQGSSSDICKVCSAVQDAARDWGATPELAEVMYSFPLEWATNAGKHAIASRAAIGMAIRESDDGRGAELEVAIADDGEGIPAAFLRSIQAFDYEPFEQIPERLSLAQVFERNYVPNGVRSVRGRGGVITIGKLFALAPTAMVWVRSGGALLRLDARSMLPRVVARASDGFGTVILARVPLPRRFS